MKNTIVIYGVAVAAAALGLQWLQYRYWVRALSSELYIVLIAVIFTALGIWVGHRLTQRSAATTFEKNTQALKYLGVSEREYEVLTLLASGVTNKEIAARLFISTNTVKTHLASLYSKLEVSRRTQAIARARQLRLIS
jgi:DNA-binding NarL/FixJ family response regulator